MPDARRAAAGLDLRLCTTPPAFAAEIGAKARKLGFAGGSKQKKEFYGERVPGEE